MTLQNQHIRLKQAIKDLFLLSTILVIYGCATQVSSLNSYNGQQRKETNKCTVVRTALESKFSETINEFKDHIQGDSHVETLGTYENEEAAFDCMAVGAKTVLVLDRGVVSTSSTYVSGTTYSSYNPATNSYSTRSTSGHYVSSKTSAYIVVFFNENIPNFGNTYTLDDYKSWKSSQGIVGCEGCR